MHHFERLASLLLAKEQRDLNCMPNCRRNANHHCPVVRRNQKLANNRQISTNPRVSIVCWQVMLLTRFVRWECRC